MEMALGAAAFVGLFALFVILPGRLQKRNEPENEASE
jgi:hypothetical protein